MIDIYTEKKESSNCFEYLILAFDQLISWTGTGKKDKIAMR